MNGIRRKHKKISRMDVYMEVCKIIGLKPNAKTPGYFSREDLLEIHIYLQRVERLMKCQPNNQVTD